MRSKLFYMVLVLVLGGVAYMGFVVMGTNYKRDFRMAYVNDDGITIKSISWQRKMVNIVGINGDVKMWIPGGLGWYEADKLKKLLAQEKQESRMSEVLFYNLGFDADLIVYDKENDRRDFLAIANKWGWNNYLPYVLKGMGGLMVKEERLLGQLANNSELLGTVMLRDLADSGVIEGEVKVSIMNTGIASGLASFLARNLEWAGVTIYSVETSSRDLSGEKCVIEYGDEVENSRAGNLLFRHLEGCNRRYNKLVTNKEVELYLSDKFAEMINYQSYIELKN